MLHPNPKLPVTTGHYRNATDATEARAIPFPIVQARSLQTLVLFCALTFGFFRPWAYFLELHARYALNTFPIAIPFNAPHPGLRFVMVATGPSPKQHLSPSSF